jgi:hypothetical protein
LGKSLRWRVQIKRAARHFPPIQLKDVTGWGAVRYCHHTTPSVRVLKNYWHLVNLADTQAWRAALALKLRFQRLFVYECCGVRNGFEAIDWNWLAGDFA